jgi:hypothetical protein
MTRPLVLVTCRQMQIELPHHRERIEQLGYQVVAPDLGNRQQFTSAELLEYSSELVGIIAGDDELDRDFFIGTPNLKTVIRWGIGMDSVDHDAAGSWNGAELRQHVTRQPVRSGLVTLQQASGAQHQRASANAGNKPGTRPTVRQKCQHFRVLHHGERPGHTTGHEQYIQFARTLGKCRGWSHRNQRTMLRFFVPDRLAIFPDQMNLPIQHGLEHGKRPHEVLKEHARVDQHADGPFVASH